MLFELPWHGVPLVTPIHAAEPASVSRRVSSRALERTPHGLRTGAWRAVGALATRAARLSTPLAWIAVVGADIATFWLSRRLGASPVISSLTALVVAALGVGLTARAKIAMIVALALLAAPLRIGVALSLASSPAAASVVGALTTVPFLAYGLATWAAMHARSRFDATHAIAIVGYAVALHVAFVAAIPLMPEEAYYWCYSRHLALGYLDHPPMVAWMIAAGTALLGRSELAVRAGALLCGVALALVLAATARRSYGRRAAWIAGALGCVFPFAFAVGMLGVPDAPLALAWAATLLGLRRALLEGRTSGWIVAGVSLGLGLLSKYTIALLVPAALAFVIVDRPSRRWLRHPAPYAAVAIAALMFSPVIAWNALNGWASFVFQSERRLAEDTGFHTGELVLSVLLTLTPVGMAAAWRVLRPRDGLVLARERWFTALMLVVPLAVFFGHSLLHPVAMHWTGPIWLALIPALAGVIAQPRMPWSLRPRTWLGTSGAILGLGACVFTYVGLDLPGVPVSWRVGPPLPWRELAATAESAARESTTGRELALVGTDKNFLASELAFYAGSRAPVRSQNLFGRAALMFEQWAPASDCDGADLLLVALSSKHLSDERVAANATALTSIRELPVRKDGREVARIFVRELHGYRAPPIENTPPRLGARPRTEH